MAETATPDPDRFFRTDHLRANLASRSVRGGAVTLTAQACRFVIQLGSTVVLARLLVPRDFGLIGMAAAITGFIAMFRDLGLSQATIQRDQITHADVSTLFWVNLGVSTVLALLTAALAPVLAWFYGEPKVTGIMIALGVGFIFGGVAVQHQALIDRQMRFTARSLVDVGSLALGAIAAIVAAMLGAGYWSLVVQTLVTAVVAAIGFLSLSQWRPSRPAWSPGARSMLTFGGHLTGYQVVNYFGRNIDNLLIGRVWGAVSLGLYSRAYQLLMLPIRQVNAPLAAVAMPALGRLRHETARYRDVYLRVFEKVALLTMPGVALLIGTSDWVVRVVLGPGWEGASGIFTWLGVAALLQPVANTTGWLFVTQERGRDMFRWGLLGTGISVAAIVAGLPWGALGVAAAYGVTDTLIKTPLLFWYVGKSGPVKTGDFYRALGAPTLAAGATLIAVFLLRHYLGDIAPWKGLALATIIGLAAGGGALVLTAAGRAALQDLRRFGALLSTRSLPT
jgi:PST family polysaccharide transporter